MAQQWQEAETQGPFTYRNRFGAATLTPVTEFMPVSGISCKVVPDEAIINIDDAERLVLITDNRRSAVSFCWPLDGRCYALKYSCPSRAAVCRVVIEESTLPEGVSPAEQIEACRYEL